MISILTPLYNGVEFLDEQINSITAQTYPHWELLIGVNGLNYKDYHAIFTKVKKHKDRRISVFHMPFIKGKCKALNSLIKHAKHENICLIDVDDKWAPNKLEKQIPYMQRYDVVGTNAEYFGDKDGTPGLYLGRIPNRVFLYQNPIVNSSVMMKKSCAKWNPRWEGLDDYQLWVHLLNGGKTFYNLPEILTYHRIHKDSYFNNKNDNASLILKSMLPHLSLEEMDEISDRISRCDWVLDPMGPA